MDAIEPLPERTLTTLYDNSYGVKRANESKKLISYAPQLPKHGMATQHMVPLILEFNLFNHDKNI